VTVGSDELDRAEGMGSRDPVDERKKESQATRLVGLAADADLFHTSKGVAYATIAVGHHTETHLLKSKGFRRWLARRFFEAEGGAPGSQAIQDALGVLEGMALFAGVERDVYVRLAEHAGAIYLDLGDSSWDAIEITRAGWELCAKPPVRFRRPGGMAALPRPARGGSIEDLRPFLNPADERDWVLTTTWLVTALRPRGPYPALNLTGEQGTGKSTEARVLRELVDPNAAELRSEPREVRDLMIAATNAWILALDNLSHISPWLSDALCRLATGAGSPPGSSTRMTKRSSSTRSDRSSSPGSKSSPPAGICSTAW